VAICGQVHSYNVGVATRDRRIGSSCIKNGCRKSKEMSTLTTKMKAVLGKKESFQKSTIARVTRKFSFDQETTKFVQKSTQILFQLKKVNIK
jgi:hypothetical protein